eukprot:CAMPEP_0168549136 /NCGR_PEP_ID=MMETSP0413-20121227/4940_1 /TAXON_ID=136452 /ORGANISM="Filamoeba nolandi, Strain NC-AS-23-1" /LENGTH=425 /DNA_ID=CAMNT_0008579499 /DNA_START=59 /DNA_END=1336 /DNA_ORIENTATION=+
MSNTASSRIQKDIKEVNSISDWDTPPIFCQVVNDNLEHVEAIIVGPPDTPYEFGFFKFDMRFTSTYPDKPPTRLNPNLYSNGKVCLSILGTWRGESADDWRSTYSINYILRAIQSLIMTSVPYHNEPGYEDLNAKYTKPEEIPLYTAKIKHEVLRIAVCGALEECLAADSANNTNNDNNGGKKQIYSIAFSDIIKHQFLLHYDSYVSRAQQELEKDGTQFPSMPFEYPENGAFGKFNYASIVQRLQDIKGRLDQETQQWKQMGHDWTKAETGFKYFRLLEEHDKIKKGQAKLDGVSTAPISDDNLFCWNATIFGPEGSLWEGGIYNVEIVFNDSDAPPRVKFLSEMWHPHITKEGTPFFITPPGSKQPVTSVIQALQKILSSQPSSSDSTWVNKEAALQFFSKKEEDVKEFKKRVQRCVRKSVDG